MPRIANVEGIGTLTFPDDAGDDEIVDFLNQQFPQPVELPPVPQIEAPTQIPPLLQSVPAPSSILRRTVADPLLGLASGVVAVPQAVVGLADIPTLGRAGKLAERAGVDFETTRRFISEFTSPELRQAQREISETPGILGKLGATLARPSTIVQAVSESLPPMLAGGAVAKGLRAIRPGLSALRAAATGEAAISGGMTAEQIRAQTEAGTLTPIQAAIATGSGVATGLLAILGGGLAARLGIADVDVLLAGGKAEAKKNVLRRIVEGALSEGVIEELPQSVQEQISQNVALGKTAMEGVADSAVQGLFAGLVTGGIASGVSPAQRKGTADAIDQERKKERLLEKPVEGDTGRETPGPGDRNRRLGPAPSAQQITAAKTFFDEALSAGWVDQETHTQLVGFADVATVPDLAGMVTNISEQIALAAAQAPPAPAPAPLAAPKTPPPSISTPQYVEPPGTVEPLAVPSKPVPDLLVEEPKVEPGAPPVPTPEETADEKARRIRQQVLEEERKKAAEQVAKLPTAETGAVDTIAGRMNLSEFERKGYAPEQVTRQDWINLQRAERRRLGQQEGGDSPLAPWAEYEEFHREAVRSALARNEAVDPQVLEDYPDLVKLPEPAPGPAPTGPQAQFSAVGIEPPPSREAALRVALDFWLPEVEASLRRILSGQRRGDGHDDRVIHQGPIILARIANFAEYGDEERWRAEHAPVQKVSGEALQASIIGLRADPRAVLDEARHYEPFVADIRTTLERLAKGTNYDVEIRAVIHAYGTAQKKAAALKQLAATRGLSVKQMQEAVEFELVRIADEVARNPNETSPPDARFKGLVESYNNQPTLAARTSTSIENQAYSTPLPLAYAMAHATAVTPQTTVYEPTGGNGALLIGANISGSHANELNPERAAALRKLGVGTVTENDATQFTPAIKVDTVRANPPFGSIPNVNYNGYSITKLEHIISLRALEAMKANGTAVLILGAKREEGPQSRGAQWIFENYVYGHYNVVANFEVEGDLYAKQGAKWPVRVIVIHGRKANPIRADLAPKEVARFKTWGEVWKEAERIRNEIVTQRPTVGTGGALGIPGPAPTGPAAPERPGGLPELERPPPPPPRPGGTRPGGIRKPRPGGQPPVGGVPGAPRPAPERPGVPRPPVPQPSSGGQPAPRVEDEGAGTLEGAPNVPPASPGTPGRPDAGNVPGTAGVSASDLSKVSDSDLEALIDSAIEGTTPAPPPAPTPAPAATAAPPSLRTPIEHGVKGAEEALKALNALFGSGTSSNLPIIDEETYQKAKPHFQKAYDEFVLAGKSLAEYLRYLIERFGAKIKPYIIRFANDLKANQPKESELQVLYRPGSKAQPFGTLTPKNLAPGIHEALAALEQRVGPIDEFVANRVNMTVDELRSVVAAEQIDGAALGIDQIENGDALIIGDEAGIGKGRQGALMIRYAIQHGKVPIFFTKDPKLFSDMWSDLAEIHTTVKPMVLGDRGKATIVDTSGNVLLVPLQGAQKKAELQRILEQGMEKAGYNAIFSTYSQIRDPNERQEFMRRLASENDTIIILDEAHEAAGEATSSMQAAFMMGGQVVRGKGPHRTTINVPGLLRAPGTLRGRGGVLYMSATYAKRSDNMPLYFRTSLQRSAQSFAQIVDAMKRGGVALQQAVSEALAKAGQYLRRERDFTGVNYETNVVDVPDQPAFVGQVDEITDILARVVRFSQSIRAAVMAASDARSTGQSEDALSMTDFASIVHNQVSQLLLAAKADVVVEEARRAVASGEKPVIALMNTMEAFLDHYVEDHNIQPGQAIQLRWNELLAYALSRTLRVSTKHPDGTTEVSTVDPAEYGLGATYDAILEDAQAVESNFPVSPIDYIIQKLTAAGVKMAELTGRDSGIQYTDFATNTGLYRKFKTANKNRVVNGFNDGTYDGMVLNASGSTGLSAHASVKFKDRRPRNMLIAQPALDINVFVQTLGRIRRTGMVLLGMDPKTRQPYGAKYVHLVLPIQAELRPAAIALKKMKSLNANTTGESKGQMKFDVVDIINQYGDQIVAEYLDMNPDIQRETGIGIEVADDGTVRVPRDVARKFTGRLALMPDAQQKEIYDALFAEYRALIEQLKQTGEYDLEIVMHDDWDGTLLHDEQLSPATDASSIFTSGTRVQRWEVSDKRHVPTGAEMLAEFQRKLGSSQKVIDEWRRIRQARTSYLENRIAEAEREAVKAEGIAAANAHAVETAYRQSLERWNNDTAPAIESVILQAGRIVRVVSNESGAATDGMLVDVKYPSGNRVAPSGFRFRFLLNSPGGVAYIKGTDLIAAKWDVERSDSTPEDLEGQTGISRYPRYFVTGNPIQAFVNTGGRGKLVRFKSRDGQTITGLLMPINWDPGKLAEDPRVQLVSGRAVEYFMRNLAAPHNPVQLEGGMVQIQKSRYQDYLITTARPARPVFLDRELRDIVGDFTKVGNRMQVQVEPADIGRAADRIMKIVAARFKVVGNSQWAQQQAARANEEGGARYAAPTEGASTIEQVEQEIRTFLGLKSLPPNVSVISDPSKPFGAVIEGRNKITLNAKQIAPGTASSVLLEEGLHGVWFDPAVQQAWQSVRDSVTAEGIEAERAKRQGLPASEEVLREEAAIAELLRRFESQDAELAKRGVWQRLLDAIVEAFRRVFGLPVRDTDLLRQAASDFLRGQRNSLPGRRLIASNAVVVAPGVSPAYSAIAYHGTPHEVTQFTVAKVGTGEGAQVYGWGLYFAQNREVAEVYAEALARESEFALNKELSEEDVSTLLQAPEFPDDVSHTSSEALRDQSPRPTWSDILDLFRSYGVENPQQAIEKITDRWVFDVTPLFGNLYTVSLNVNDDELLDWDRPLSEQSEKVKGALVDNYEFQQLEDTEAAGSILYNRLQIGIGQGREGGVTTPTAQLISEYLASLGIKGIRYLDQGSRSPLRAIDLGVSPVTGKREWALPATNQQLADMRFISKEDAEEFARNYRTYNYVIFSDSDITITARNGEPVPLQEAMDSPDVRFAAPTVPGAQPEDVPREMITPAGTEGRVYTQVFSRQEEVRGRPTLSDDERVFGGQVAKQFFDDLGIPTVEAAQHTRAVADEVIATPNEELGQAIFKKYIEFNSNLDRNFEDSAQRAAAAGTLLNSLRNFLGYMREKAARGQPTAFSANLLNDLWSIVQGEASFYGMLLNSLRGMSESILWAARNAATVLRTMRSEAFGGPVLDKMLADFRAEIAALAERANLAEQLRLAATNQLALTREELADLTARLGNLDAVIKKALDGALATPFKNSTELADTLAGNLMTLFNLEDSKKPGLKASIKAVLNAFLKVAAPKAADTAHGLNRKSLPSKSRLWRRIRAAILEGNYDADSALAKIAQKFGWTIPAESELDRMRNWLLREEELRTLKPEVAERLKDDKEALKAAQIELEAATATERGILIRNMQTLWGRWTRPTSLNPLKWFPFLGETEIRQNNAQAINEWITANILLKFGFFVRQGIDVGWQSITHDPTAALGVALTTHKDEIARGVFSPSFWNDAGLALRDSYTARVKTLKDAIASAQQALKDRNLLKNADQIISRIGLFDRLQQKANELSEKGRSGEAFIVRLLAYVRFSYLAARALDMLQGTGAEYARMAHIIRARMRENGKTNAEIQQQLDLIFKEMSTQRVEALARARQIADAYGIETDASGLREAAGNILRARAYATMKIIQNGHEDLAAAGELFKNTIGWNERETTGIGGVVAGIFRGVQRTGERAGIPLGFVSAFGNAIGIGINRKLTWMGLGKLAHLGAENPWYRTELDQNQRLAEGLVGAGLSAFLVFLVMSGAIAVRLFWPRDDKEREKWIAEGRRAGTVEIPTGDGQFMPISLAVGPLAMFGPALAGAASMRNLLDKRTKEQAKLNEEAEKRGVTPGKLDPISGYDLMSTAGNAFYASLLNSRTAGGFLNAMSDQGMFDLRKMAATFVSDVVPLLPAWQEIMRAGGVYLNPRLATFGEMLVPTPGSGARRVNVLGQPSGTQDMLQSIVQVMTSGTFPGVIDPKTAQNLPAYRALFAADYVPSPPQPGRGYVIKGQYRPMTKAELAEYTVRRGQYLAQELSGTDVSGLSQPEARKVVEKAVGTASNRALESIGGSPGATRLSSRRETLPSSRAPSTSTAQAAARAPAARAETRPPSRFTTRRVRGTRLRIRRPRIRRMRLRYPRLPRVRLAYPRRGSTRRRRAYA